MPSNYNRIISGQGLDKGLRLNFSLLQLITGATDENCFVDSEKSDALADAVDSLGRQLRLYRKRLHKKYDVFLCHNSVDKPEVRIVARQIMRCGSLPWFDEQQLVPGENWISVLGQNIESTKVCAIFLGSSGVGPWQQNELDATLQLIATKKLK